VADGAISNGGGCFYVYVMVAAILHRLIKDSLRRVLLFGRLNDKGGRGNNKIFRWVQPIHCNCPSWGWNSQDIGKLPRPDVYPAFFISDPGGL
jgi:hypothetical protein